MVPKLYATEFLAKLALLLNFLLFINISKISMYHLFKTYSYVCCLLNKYVLYSTFFRICKCNELVCKPRLITNKGDIIDNWLTQDILLQNVKENTFKRFQICILCAQIYFWYHNDNQSGSEITVLGNYEYLENTVSTDKRIFSLPKYKEKKLKSDQLEGIDKHDYH